MDNLFSSELKELVLKSRNIAIELGYDHISTIHFFIADCDISKQNSIFKFAFANEKEYEEFKTSYTLVETNTLDLQDESLPLTKEAEKTIRLTDYERILRKQTEVFPCHFFLAALKNRDSFLSVCFEDDSNALDSLVTYYENLGEFEKSKMNPDQISKEYFVPNQNEKNSFLGKVLKFFKG